MARHSDGHVGPSTDYDDDDDDDGHNGDEAHPISGKGRRTSRNEISLQTPPEEREMSLISDHNMVLGSFERSTFSFFILTFFFINTMRRAFCSLFLFFVFLVRFEFEPLNASGEK